MDGAETGGRCAGCGADLLSVMGPRTSATLCVHCRLLPQTAEDLETMLESSRRRLLSAMWVLRLIEAQMQQEMLLRLMQASLTQEALEGSVKKSENDRAAAEYARNMLHQLKQIPCHHTALRGEQCAVCMDDFDDAAAAENRRPDDAYLQLPCSHTFHRACLSDWLLKSLTCPTCRQEVRVVQVPSPEELASLSRTELLRSLAFYHSDDAEEAYADDESASQEELSLQLHNMMQSKQRAMEEQQPTIIGALR